MKLTVKTNNKLTTEIVKNYQEKTIKTSEAIRQLFNNGLEVKTISELLEKRYQHCYNTIKNSIYKQEIDNSKIEIKEKSSEKRNKIIELLDQEKTPSQIAIELKSNINYIYKIRKEYNATKEAK